MSLSVKPYKGSRDFYPEEMRSREWMFDKLAKTAESFGYERIDAPLIEPVELYLAKTSEEIVNQQIYSFEDRGNRRVAIRPEMTPTVARMAAGKIRELVKPIRWYSIPNLWRYERPGKGRLREHWQLNCDIFGAAEDALADTEILSLALEIMLGFGATEGSFRLYLNHRKLLTAFFENILQIVPELYAPVARLMDKKEKLPVEAWEEALREAGISDGQIAHIAEYMHPETGMDYLDNNKQQFGQENVEYLLKLIEVLTENGYGNYLQYNPAVVRGFDYYTGMVFEVFDSHPENNRSLFGGGRYDNLVGNFIKQNISGVGFGMGDVTFAEFLKIHGLYREFPVKTRVFIPVFPEHKQRLEAQKLARELRHHGINVELSTGPDKLGKQLQIADNRGISLVLILGEDEIKSNTVTLKNLKESSQKSVPRSDILKELA